MIALILTVCLAADPSSCREEHIPVEIPAGSCYAIGGQTEAIKWLDDHPKLMLRGWRCEPVGKDA